MCTFATARSSVRSLDPLSTGGLAWSVSRPAMLSLLEEIWAFMRVRKKWWLGPIVLVLVLFGALIVLSQGSALAPFVYTLF